jgi:hypothetical protein
MRPRGQERVRADASMRLCERAHVHADALVRADAAQRPRGLRLVCSELNIVPRKRLPQF